MKSTGFFLFFFSVSTTVAYLRPQVKSFWAESGNANLNNNAKISILNGQEKKQTLFTNNKHRDSHYFCFSRSDEIIKDLRKLTQLNYEKNKTNKNNTGTADPVTRKLN